MPEYGASFGVGLEPRIVIGGTPDDIGRVRALVRKLHLQQRVFLLGPRPLAQLTGFLAQADILISPRQRGSNTPMKIYSYMNSGIAILAAHTQVLHDEGALAPAARSSCEFSASSAANRSGSLGARWR